MSTTSPELVIERLFETLRSRSIHEGLALIKAEDALLRAISPSDPCAPKAFYALAAWGDYSKTAAQTAQPLRAAYAQPLPRVSLDDWGWIEGGRALLALREGKYVEVGIAWKWVHDNLHRFNASPELLATLDFANAHAQRKCANYPIGLELIQSAIRRFGEAKLPGMVAVAQVLEGWLLTQMGDRQAASQSWAAALAFLQGTDDWTILANIAFSRARDRCRAGFEEEGRALYLESASLHRRMTPPHRNLPHVYTDLADLDLRVASKCADQARARELRKTAAKHLGEAEALLDQDTSNHRNRIRLLLAQANLALLAPFPAFFNARLKARQAYALAREHGEKLMIARSLYKLAVIEKRDSEDETCDQPLRRRLKACAYALAALELAEKLYSDRLAARIHTLLGNLFLEFPFCDPDYAAQHWYAAVERMREHEDLDYVVKHIDALNERLESFSQHAGLTRQKAKQSPLIIAVSEQPAIANPLEETLRHVEKAIVLAAVEWIGPNARFIADHLHAGHVRVAKILDSPHSPKPSQPLAGEHVIFRVKAAFAFSRPLQETIKAVERAIIIAAWIRYGYDKRAVKEKLHIGFDKVVSALEDR